ncbi:sphingoid long chain base kinase-like protein [Xylariaceae sp. FL0255]|nr:sphingoid long chain base kinase-like protein [Xylariaceae sp. FL0255]
MSESAALVAKPEVLNLENGIRVTLKANSLVVKDKVLAKGNRTRICGLAIGSMPSEITISYYNVLWASVSDNRLRINYAVESSKNNVKVSRLTYTLGDVSPATAEEWAEVLLVRAYGKSPRRKYAKIFINPNAGPGHATRLWQREAQPLFEAAHIALDIVTTTGRGEAEAMCKILSLDRYDTIVVCSGDGLVYEVFNGLGKRPDARRALQTMAVAHIPCGSGNAMSINVNGSHRVGPAALAVIKGVRTSIDLMSITQGPRRTLSFLSQAVGIIAEADLGTENMRWMGAKRFDVGVVTRILSQKCYPCDIAVKVEIEDRAQVKAHYRRNREGHGESKEDQAGTPATADDSGPGLPPLRYGTVNDEIPDDWERLSYPKLGNFYCGNMAWMAPNANFFPAACADDGLMDMVINDGNIPAMKYADLMLSVEKGKFFDNPLISYRKVAAYRFTPKDQETGLIDIDGEEIPFEPFQVEIHRGLGTVLTKSGRYEAPGPSGWQKAT